MSAAMVFTAYVDSAEMGRQVRRRLLELCTEWDVAPEIQVVDVTSDPAAAETNNVVGIPTVVRTHPRPRRRVIGVLDDTRRVAEALGLDERPDDITEAGQSAGVVDDRA